MRLTLPQTFCAALFVFAHAGQAHAGMFLTGSVSGSQSNIAYQTYESQYASGSFGFDLGRFIRISYSHSQETATNTGYTDPRTEEELNSSNAVRADSNLEPEDDGYLVAYSTRSHVVGNSVDLQLVLYAGEIFVPYITGGVIHKKTTVVSEQEGKEPKISEGGGVGPNLGAGLGIRLNREFTLKLTYIASPGAKRAPGDPEQQDVWDKKVTLGLTYQL